MDHVNSEQLTALLTRLRRYPYVPLDITVPLSSLQTEYDQLASHGYELRQYQTNYRLVRNYYARSWSGICLISSDGGLYTDLSEGDIQSSVNEFSVTELTHHCPTFYQLIDTLNGGARKTRARIMKIAPSRSLLWHSHVLEHGQPEYILTIQVPLYVPPAFIYCVVDRAEFRWYRRFSSYKRFKSACTVNLKPGNAYVFNSYHYHNVFNLDPQNARLTLMVYLDLRHPAVFNLVSRSVKRFCAEAGADNGTETGAEIDSKRLPYPVTSQVEPLLSA